MKKISANFQLDFGKKKLAEKLNILPDLITSTPYGMEYRDKSYSIKSANPTRLSKDKEQLFWDFDLRYNYWEDGANKKIRKLENGYEAYILIGMINNVPRRVFIVPATKTPSTHIRILVEGRSKYKEYEI